MKTTHLVSKKALRCSEEAIEMKRPYMFMNCRICT